MNSHAVTGKPLTIAQAAAATRLANLVMRRARVVTQTEVGRICGVSRTQIANFMAGKTDLSMSAGLRLLTWLDEQSEVSR